MADIIELIADDRRRVTHLWEALRDAGREDGAADWRQLAGRVWEQLAAVVEAHAEAEEEICHLPMFGASPHSLERIDAEVADLDDIREAVGEARLQFTGSPVWWQQVDAAVSAFLDHLDRQQHGVLAEYRRRAGRARRERLGSQWLRFMAARLGDLVPGAYAGGLACQLCELPIPGEHRHVLDAGQAAIWCTCQRCYELSRRSGGTRPAGADRPAASGGSS